MSNPKFSIILPTHNGAERIKRAIRSCVNQVYKNYELIVICDSCTDNTADIANSYQCKVISGEFHNDGLARNAGLDTATGEWVLFIDDDDWWMHEYVLQLLAFVADSNAGCDAIFFSFIKRGVGYIKQTPDNLDPLSAGHCWKRSFIGSERFPNRSYGSDNAFFYSLIGKQPDVVFWDNPLYYYDYMRKGSLSERHKRGEV